MGETFGKVVKKLRLDAKLTLRDFSARANVDPGNWSRIEREIALPPKGNEFFTKLEKVLKLGKAARDHLVELAKAARIIPQDLRDSALMEHLPVMFRRANGEEPTKKEVEHLVDWLKRKVKEEHSDE